MTITAKIIADSISPDNIRLTTLQLRYPRFIHAEFMTHRQFSRNASSSRAVPVEKLIKDIQDDTAMPIHWGKNIPGMQANEECDSVVNVSFGNNKYTQTRLGAWEQARDNAIDSARSFNEAGYHKQIVNRLLEPFSHINVIVSSTEWSNFFRLRIDPGAQPEMQELARSIKLAMDTSEPQKLNYGEWHLPYILAEDGNSVYEKLSNDGVVCDTDDIEPYCDGYKTYINYLIKMSVARCARVSYMTYEMKKPTLQEDLKLYDRLLGAQPIHASPSEHQARPLWHCGKSHLTGNFRGWIQYRKTLEGECQ